MIFALARAFAFDLFQRVVIERVHALCNQAAADHLLGDFFPAAVLVRGQVANQMEDPDRASPVTPSIVRRYFSMYLCVAWLS